MFSPLRTGTRALILAIAATIISFPVQAGDTLTGTWELNLGKSKFINAPPPKNETRTYEVTGQQVKMTAERIDAKGQRVVYGYTANPDGKDYPYTGNPIHDTISITPVDSLMSNYTLKGKVAGVGTRTVSPDGKTMTISFEGTNPKGQTMEILFFFDKR